MATCVELGHALGNQHWPAVMYLSLMIYPYFP
jgi:urease accessory protein UreE